MSGMTRQNLLRHLILSQQLAGEKMTLSKEEWYGVVQEYLSLQEDNTVYENGQRVKKGDFFDIPAGEQESKKGAYFDMPLNDVQLINEQIAWLEEERERLLHE